MKLIHPYLPGMCFLLFLSSARVAADPLLPPDNPGIQCGCSLYGESPLRIEVFYAEGCVECESFRQTVLPRLHAQFQYPFTVQWHDISEMTNYLRLVAYQEQLGVEGNPSLYLVLDAAESLSGLKQVDELLVQRMEARVERGVHGEAVVLPADKDRDWMLLQKRYDSFTVAGVMTAGLVDGINPCSISALVLILSMVTVGAGKTRRVGMIGALFVVSTYVTYFLLGYGAFRALGITFSAGWQWRKGLEVILGSVLIGLAFLSFHDAWSYHRSGHGDSVRLQLPGKMKSAVHQLVRRCLRGGYSVPTVVFLGVAVTLMESVCTGQVYVPTLVWLLRDPHTATGAIGYLALYNLMHVTPLVIAFVLAWKGLGTPFFIQWSRLNVVPAKCAAGFFLLAMAGIILTGT